MSFPMPSQYSRGNYLSMHLIVVVVLRRLADFGREDEGTEGLDRICDANTPSNLVAMTVDRPRQ